MRSSAVSPCTPHEFTLDNYREIFTNPVWYWGYFQLHHLRHPEHHYLALCGPAGGLRLLPLSVSRRQASVLLAADKPDGAARGLRPALPSALFGCRAFRHPHRGGVGPLPVQHPAGRVDPGRLYVGCPEGVGRDGLCRRLFVPALLLPHLPADHQIRHRRYGVLLLHVLVGRTLARQEPDLRRRQADRGRR